MTYPRGGLEPRRVTLVCSSVVDQKEYDVGLHVMALAVVFVQSLLSSGFPLVAKKYPRLRVPASFFFFTPHFGTGVILATAFIHLLPTTFISLTNPCLGSFWTQDYPAIGGAISMATIFIIAIIEMLFTNGLCRQRCPPVSLEAGPHTCGTPCKMQTPDETTATKENTKLSPSSVSLMEKAPVAKLDLTPEQIHKKAMLQLLMLEIGILFHSIFIGMTVSVTVGRGFIILLIAVIFHQTFEGLALGTRVAALKWKTDNCWTPWLMALAYGFTMPLGQAIGLATHTLYSPSSPAGLLMVGILSSISAGMLLFAGLAEMLSEDFLRAESWEKLNGRTRVVAGLWLLAGALGMSLVGAWA